MDSLLPLQQKVRNAILLGESHFREFKTALEGKPENKKPRSTTAICREIGEALVAFTNADGGDIIIGVEDDGTITGLAHTSQEIEVMLNAIHTHILDSKNLPIQHSLAINIDDKIILFFSVLKSPNKIFQLPDGRCMKRQDKSSVPAAFLDIQLERAEIISRNYDHQFVDGATTIDLDIHLVQRIADEYLRGMSPEQYLQQVNLAEYGPGTLRLRRAALLLFATDITRWFPRCQVRIIKVDGNEILPGTAYNVTSDEYVTGNIFNLLSSAWERLRPYLSKKTVFGENAKFEQTFSYPEDACREALINLIAHRDYSISNPSTIYIYSNRLVFESPGELLSTISIEDLRRGVGVHESRNTNIARILRENKYMRELGEGIRRIFALFKSQELALPQLSSENGSFLVSMNQQSIYSQKELEWLSLFKNFELNSYQKQVIVAGIDKRKISQNLIYSVLGSSDRNLYDRTVTALRINNILKEIRSNAEANRIAGKTGKKKQEIERYEIVVPTLQPEDPLLSSKIYVYNLPQEVTKEVLADALSLFGKVKAIDIPIDEETKQVRGFAFVEFEDSTQALRAIAIKNLKVMDSISVIVPYKPFQSRKHYRRR